MNRYRVILIIIAGVLFSLTGTGDVFGGNGSGGLAGSSDNPQIEPWLDSINTQSALAEHDLQYYLDSLGYDIDVANDELGFGVFCGIPGVNTATMIIEVAGSAVYATSGYYPAGDTSVLYQIFGPSDAPGDSVQFTFTVLDSIGFYMKPNLPNQNHTWLTENHLNSDNFDHAWVFSTGVPYEYLICFEDLPDGGDMDYQDLVIKVRFSNQPPELTLPDDYTVTMCTPGPICFDIIADDPNCQIDSVWLEMLSGGGTFTPAAGPAPVEATHCFTPPSNGVYSFVFQAEDILGETTVDTVNITVTSGSVPQVEIDDTTIALCEPAEVCLPVSIYDPDCDIVSVTTNYGTYTGSLTDFDQVARIVALGGGVIQIGGGAPGQTLFTGDDFVGPVNSQSGVSVTLPNFEFADDVVNSGSFPTGTEPGNSADHLLGPPTDMTFTAPGAGGPDGGSGDGSVAFSQGNRCVLGFPQDITTCHGANVDFFMFTNTAGSGTAQLRFRLNGQTQYTTTVTVPSASASTGTGGITLDLPDGITFNQLRIKCTSGSFEADAFGVRTAPSSSTEDVCFAVDTSGVYEIIVTATDSCGNVGADTALVTVNMNSAPVADAGPDVNAFMCEWDEVCIDVSFSDPDDNITLTELYSGPGSLVGDQVCFTPGMAGVNTFVIHAVDECGLEDFDTVTVTVSDNDPPIATDPQDVTGFFCTPQELCHDFTATDPNGGTLTWTHLAGVGTITTDGHFCFTPTVSGTYSAAVTVTDSCGAADTTDILYDLIINTAPVATDPSSPVPLFQCTPAEVCFQFEAADQEGGSLTWSLLSGPGAITGSGLFCFTPSGTGSYTATVAVIDSCGLADTAGLTYDVTLNEAPVITIGPDSTLELCDPQEICISYNISDPQGLNGLTEQLVSGPGGAAIDTAANQVCFTPTADGCQEFVVRVTDSCGSSDLDTVTVCVSFGDVAQIDCPAEEIDVFLCEADQVCQGLAITPSTATVYTSFGVYSSGQLCFQADTTGTYVITVVAQEECGADTCQLTFNVEIGEAAQIDCPDPQSKFICEAGNVCVPVGVYGGGAVVSVSPIGSYGAGNLCFPADSSGHYEILIVATTDCGTDSCLVVVDVTINTPPVADDPGAPDSTFLCESAQVCYQFGATDVDGGTLIWTRLSGDGTITPDGLWCFTASGGSHSVVVQVTDSCGAADTTTHTYNVLINSAPMVDLGHDTTHFICASGIVCHHYTAVDVDGNLASLELIYGDGTLDTSQSRICFVPTVSGDYEFVLKATDDCGAEDVDTLTITIDINQPPVLDAGDDMTVFACTLEEICWTISASDPDGNLDTVELVEGPGELDGTTLCFTSTGTYNYEFVLKATDLCGAETYDTVAVFYTLNSAPTADAGDDQTLFFCDPTEVCWAVSSNDVDGNLSGCALVSGPGVYDGSEICFTPSVSGVYEFVIECSDACGATDRDTVLIDVTINSAPACVVPNDTLIFQCSAAQICLPAYATDVDGNLQFCQIVSGPGTLVGNDWCYQPVSDQTVTVTLRCQDSCGAICESTFSVEIDLNGPPEIAFGNDTSFFLCESAERCLPYVATDPDDPRPTAVTLVSGSGTLDEENSQVCFTPTVGGSYTFIIRIEDECYEVDEDTINVDVTFNTPPVADAGADQTLFLCDSTEEVCWPASCSDVDGNLTDCIFNGPGAYDGSQICFNPPVSGSYLFTLRAVDACGEVHVDSVTIGVTINSDPIIALGSDTSLFLCTPQQICLAYTVSDPDGSAGLTETMVSGYGTLDTAANQVCFTPTADGCYEFVLRVRDSCNAEARDTVEVCVTFGESAQIDCPSGPMDVFLCAIDSVCQALTVTPSTAAVTVSNGVYADGELCFLADTSGTYNITVIASESCGADTCELTFNVDIGEAASVDCPDPGSDFVCWPGDEVCVEVGVYGSGAVVEVSPIGIYGSGQLCFPADTAGHYEILVVATTECGTDSCLVEVDVSINEPPVAVDPPPADTFICEPATLCCPFEAADADADDLTWNRLSGDGTVSVDGEWCIMVSESGTYTVCAIVSDSCGATDTVCATKTVTVNTPPTIAWTRDDVLFLCEAGNVCKQYTVTDPDDNGVVEQLLVPFGTIDTAANEVCFFADTSGVYTLIVGATDDCGASDADTTTCTVQINSPPTADAGSSQTVFQCNPTELCWPATCSDPDDNLDSCYVTEGVGIFAAGQICFTPDTAGTYSIVLRAVDTCGAFDEDTVMVQVTLNSEPVCNIDGDTTFFQCEPEQISRRVTATDIDLNFDHCEIITGPGSIVDSQWIYTPTADQTVKVRIMCLDACGAYCEDSFTVVIDINSPPTVNSGDNQTIFLCQPETICWPVEADDEDGNLMLVELLDGSEWGDYDPGTGEICFPVPAGERSYRFVVKATDSCLAVDYDTTVINVEFNAPPTLDLPGNPTVYLEEPGEVCIGIDVDDEDDNLQHVDVSPIGTYSSATGRICFDADTTGHFCLEVTATDECQESVIDTICVDVVIDECIHVQIEKTHDAIQGQFETVRIFLNGSGKELGGYDLLIGYDQSALTVQSVEPGVLLTDCGWEYFNYRHGPDGNCGNGCPSGILRILAFAETNNGANHPGCFLEGLIGSIADIEFLVSDDRTLECQYVPISFFWMDCGDNSFSGRWGDTLWISRYVYTFENDNITDALYGFPGYYGAPDECLIQGDPDKPTPLRCVDFTNGGVDIICADSIDDRGDVNLNGVANEVADAVVFSNYFVHGLDVFTVNIDGQIAATDVNTDGVTLSVADLVYLIRIIVGDSSPMPKFAPGQEPEVRLVVKNGVLEVAEADYRIGAISVILDGEVQPKLHEQAAAMEMRYSYDGEHTRVLIYNMEGRAFLDVGPVLQIGDGTIKSIDVGSYDGFTLVSKTNELPRSFHLAQNYPNPFNPSTTFEFALPVATEWRLVVYNVLGQTVRTWDGEHEAGYVQVNWDASAYASGVYFYRLKAGDFTATKKMVLLK